MQSTPSTHFDRLPGQLPPDLIHEGLRIDDLPKLTQRSLESLESSALSEGCLWRDWLSITGKVRTYCGAHQVAETWRTNCTPLTFSQIETFPARVVRPAPATSWADVQFNFTAKDSSGLVGISSGTASFIPDQHRVGDWKIWMLATMLDHFVSHGHPDSPPPGPPRSLSPSEVDGFSVIIVGAGQSGLSIAGRLQTLGISYVLLEQKSRVGHGWYGKYDSVTLHTTKEFNNLPFERLWSADDPNRLPARKVVEGFERFIHRYKINVWFSCHIEGARWDADARVWSIRVDAGDRGTRSLRSRHLALTMGAGHAIPNRPCWPGVEEFQGTLLHSSEYKNSRAWEGRRGIVVGTGTSAHDVAQDMFDAGLSSVTMVQRQKTAVWPFEWLSRGQAQLYNREIPTSRADAIGAIFPEKISRDIMKRVLQAHAEEEKDWFDALEHSGFRLDREIGLNDCIQGRYGGYYVDVGTSEKIISGEIKVKSGVPVVRYTRNGILFSDGSELQADAIVLATGYDHDYRKQAAQIVGWDIASKLEDFWGVDGNGDMRGVMKPVHPGLWLLGGSIPQARFYSRFIALQIQRDQILDRKGLD